MRYRNGVAGFNLTYLAEESRRPGKPRSYSTEWNSNETLSLPVAVNVNLVMRNPRGDEYQFNTLVMIPISQLISGKLSK